VSNLLVVKERRASVRAAEKLRSRAMAIAELAASAAKFVK
jgi:hypothetical protein